MIGSVLTVYPKDGSGWASNAFWSSKELLLVHRGSCCEKYVGSGVGCACDVISLEGSRL